MSDGRDDTQAKPAGGVKPSSNLLLKWLHAPYWGPGKFIEQRDELIGNWALAPTWTFEEGACLANTLSPHLMWRHENFPRPHHAAESVNRLLEFARRACRQHQISSHPTPAEFIAWSEGVGFPFDAKWLEAIGEPRVDDDWTSQSQRPIKRTGRRGRKASYDWTGARAEFDRLMEHHGDLMIEDSDWSSQADVERAIAQWFFKLDGNEPAVSTIRIYVTKWLTEYEADKADN